MVQQDRPERKDRGGTQDEAGGREASIQVLHLLHERTVEDGVAANRPRQRLAAVGWYGHWRVRLRQDLGACTDMPRPG